MTQSDRARPPTVGNGGDLSAAVRAGAGLVCGVDFDGTLAPIVTEPAAAQLDPAVVDPLGRLAGAETVAVAVVSGRSLADLADRVPLDDAILAGNHGLEVRRDGERAVVPEASAAETRIAGLAEQLRERLGAVPGCRVEDKGLTLSVHVRETPAADVPNVRSAVTELVETADDLRLVDGKAVFEVRPAIDHDKGTAMETVLGSVPDDWVGLYVGDDTTDEDAFRALQPEGIGVHVGSDAETVAAYTLPDQSAVAPFLEWLADEVADGDGKAV